MSERIVWEGAELELIEPPMYVVRPTSDVVEAWSTFRLPYQPKGGAIEFRRKLSAAISSLTVGPDRVLCCTYRSASADFVDTENVLIYNLGESCFSDVAAYGIRFERVFREPPALAAALRDPGPRHYVTYSPIAPSVEFTSWQRGRSIATWTDAAWPSDAGTSPTPFWLAIRKASPQKVGSLRERAGLFGLQVAVAGAGSPIKPAKMIKPVFDAAISAFHVHNDPAAMGKAIDRLVARGRGDAATLAHLLTDQEWNLLGSRNLVATYRSGLTTDGVKWNPEDERCVAGELLWAPGSGPMRFSGELFEAVPRPG